MLTADGTAASAPLKGSDARDREWGAVRDEYGVTDAHLVQWAQDGYDEAFELLVRRHRLRAYRVALRLTGSPADAEDVAQDAFVQAWRSLHRFRRDAAFTTWLYRIVTNVALNRVQRQRETPHDVTVLEQRPTLETPEQVSEANEALERLQSALTALPFDQRAPLVLHALEGCSYEEVADILRITVPAVKGRLHRARRDLARALQDPS